MKQLITFILVMFFYLSLLGWGLANNFDDVDTLGWFLCLVLVAGSVFICAQVYRQKFSNTLSAALCYSLIMAFRLMFACAFLCAWLQAYISLVCFLGTMFLIQLYDNYKTDNMKHRRLHWIWVILLFCISINLSLRFFVECEAFFYGLFYLQTILFVIWFFGWLWVGIKWLAKKFL